jgi:hypothetical protein
MIKTTPMIFNTEMVRAMLASNKTQTRRIIKPQPTNTSKWFGWIIESSDRKNEGCAGWINEDQCKHYSKPPCNSGDLIYVRETFGFSDPDYYDYETPMDVVYLETLNRPAPRIPDKW